MKAFPKIGITLALAFAMALPAASPATADSRAERVRKFQGSLKEEVVRDSGKPLPASEKKAVTAEAALWIGAGIVLLLGLQRLAARFAARRREKESVTRYLTENLMTPGAVHDHLDRTVEARIPLTVWIDDHFIKFSSHPDSVSADRSQLVILPLAPAAGNDMLRSSRAVRVEYLYQRVPYHFDSAWAGEDGDRGSFVHRLAIPSRIDFTQRREAYRIDPPLSGAVSCRVAGSGPAGMNVLDLSTGGFSVATSERFRPGAEISSVRLEGGTLLPVEGAARCVYELSLSESKSRHRFRYGFEFTRLAEGCDRRIMLYVSKLQISDLSRRREMES